MTHKLNHNIPDNKRKQYEQLLGNLKEMRTLEQEKLSVLNKMIDAIENQLNTQPTPITTTKE